MQSEPVRGQATRDRILDAAEQLFSQQGIDGTSLREITRAASVNLAAVNYHFQSKEVLVRAVFARRVGPLNQIRLLRIEEAEREAAPNAPTLEAIFNALIEPVIQLRADAPNFVPLLGRMYTEPGNLIETVIYEHMSPVRDRFIPALQKALPHLSPEDLRWRIQFTIGAVGHLLAGWPLIRAISGGVCDPTRSETLLRQLKPYVLAAFAAPAPKEDTK